MVYCAFMPEVNKPLAIRCPDATRKKFQHAAIDADMAYGDFLEHIMDRSERLTRLEMAMPSLAVQP